MLNIRLVCVGRLKEQFYTDAVNEYIKRLAGYCKPEIIEVPEHHIISDNPARAKREIALEKESAAIRRVLNTHANNMYVKGEGNLPSSTLTIALCIEGREMDSEAFSEFLSESAIKGTSRLCYIIGGSYGLHDSIKNEAVVKLSLSKMTYPHNLARVILLEQLYRAFKIIEGGKYHK